MYIIYVYHKQKWTKDRALIDDETPLQSKYWVRLDK